MASENPLELYMFDIRILSDIFVTHWYTTQYVVTKLTEHEDIYFTKHTVK